MKESDGADACVRACENKPVTFFLAEGVVSRYLRSLGSDWRDGGGAPPPPPPVEDDALGDVPFVSAAVAADATDVDCEWCGCCTCCCCCGDDWVDDVAVDADRNDDGVGGDEDVGIGAPIRAVGCPRPTSNATGGLALGFATATRRKGEKAETETKTDVEIESNNQFHPQQQQQRREKFSLARHCERPRNPSQVFLFFVIQKTEERMAYETRSDCETLLRLARNNRKRARPWDANERDPHFRVLNESCLSKYKTSPFGRSFSRFAVDSLSL